MSDEDRASWAPFGRYADEESAQEPPPSPSLEPPAAPPPAEEPPAPPSRPAPSTPTDWPPPAAAAPAPPAPPAPAPARKKTADRAVASLVLGFLGLSMCPVLGSVGAIALGIDARRQIHGRPSLGGETMAAWGIGLGVVGLAFSTVIIATIAGG